MSDEHLFHASGNGRWWSDSNITPVEKPVRRPRRVFLVRPVLLAVLAGLMATSGCDRYEWDSEKQQIKYRFTHPWEGYWASKTDMFHWCTIHTIATADGELRSDGAMTIQNEWHDRKIVSMDNVKAVEGGIRFSTGRTFQMGPPASSIKDAIVDTAIDIAVDSTLSPDPDRREMFFDGTNLYEWDGQSWFVINEVPFVGRPAPAGDDTYPEDQ